MADPTMRVVLAELAEQRAEQRALRARVADGSGQRRGVGRFLPLMVAGLLVALLPLSLLAANLFDDLNTGSVHNANIDAIYNAGITTGCVPNESYCPTDNVTRQEMASFLARTAGLGGNPPVANAKTAQTADQATNAQMLGGQTGSAYVRRGELRARAVLNAPGQLPLTSAQFTVGGGPLVFLTSGSGSYTAAGILRLDMTLRATGGGYERNLVAAQVYSNEASSNKDLSSTFLVLDDVPAGAYTVTLNSPTMHTSAANLFVVTLLEFPQP